MEFIKAKTILNRVKSGDEWFGLDYNFNLYRGCPHGCIYCDSRCDYYGIEDFDRVRAKENCLEILEHELSHKRIHGVIGIGAMSDAYNPQEAKYNLTREALKLIAKYSFGVSIETKSKMIVRDVDVLQEIGERNNVITKMTITTPHDEIAKKIEPFVSRPSERFSAVKAMNEAGIFTGIIFDPVLPFITDNEEDIRELARLGAENGAKFIYCHFMGVTLRNNQRDYFYSKIGDELKQRYIETYGRKYICRPLEHEKLRAIFEEECKKYGLLFKMKDIIQGYKHY